jgi:RNA polymerase sigma-70 factor (ECF subfamily)
VKRASTPAFARSRTGPASDSERFRLEILPHLDAAYNLARFLTRDSSLSDDIVQDSLVRAFRGFAGFRGSSPRAWLLAIVRNCSRSALAATAASRWATVESALSEEDVSSLHRRPDSAPGPEEELIRKDRIDSVRSAIEAIPEPFREALVLRDMEGLSYAEVAQVAGVAIGTVMSRIARGRSMLASQLLPRDAKPAEQSRSAK